MMIFLGGYFSIQGVEPVETGSATNITGDSNYTGYKITGGSNFLFDATTISIFGISVGIGLLTSWAIKSPVPIGASLFGGFLVALFVGGWSIVNNLTQGSWSNWIITGIVSLIAIIIGIISAWTIIEIFAGQAGAD
jgi:hypothetical protein